MRNRAQRAALGPLRNRKLRLGEPCLSASIGDATFGDNLAKDMGIPLMTAPADQDFGQIAG